MFLRAELGKTRDILGKMLITRSENSEVFAKTHQLMIDVLKAGDFGVAKFETPVPADNTYSEIPTDVIETAAGDIPSGDWAVSCMDNEHSNMYNDQFN